MLGLLKIPTSPVRIFPLRTWAAAGDWGDVTTLPTCNQHADQATLMKVIEAR